MLERVFLALGGGGGQNARVFGHHQQVAILEYDIKGAATPAHADRR